MELILQVLAQEPVAYILSKESILLFAILLIVILVVPILFERLRLSGLIGLVLSGIVLGSHGGWNLLGTQSQTLTLLSKIGLFYLMFVAGLGIDTQQFRCRKNSCLIFGSFTFFIPLLVGILIGLFFNYQWNSVILIGSLFASQTLLAYPILSRLGVVNNEAVGITIGSTIVTNLGTVFILSFCVAINTHEYNFWNEITFLNLLVIYSLIVLAGFDWAGKEFFRRSGNDEGNQFLFVLLAVFLATVGAQLIGTNKIVGAFLAGLAVNNIIVSGSVKEKVLFIGNVLFIPIFLINLGLEVDLSTFTKSFTTVSLTLAMILGLVASKFLAAFLTKQVYHFNWQEMLTMWSVSLPQASITLAATLVGYQTKLLDLSILNSIVVLMFFSSTLGPLLTSRFAVGLTPGIRQEESSTPLYQKKDINDNPLTIVVPVYNPQTQQYLIEMAGLLARQVNGKVIPLAVATAAAHMDAPQLEASLQRSERLLFKAMALCQLLNVQAQPLLRIDDAFAQGISRAAKEQKANLIIMGWGKRTGLRARLFGSVIDSVLFAAHCPVAVTRLVESPKKIQRILVPVENLISPALQPVQFAQILAEANQAQVTVLNVCERRTSSSKIAWRRSRLSLLVSKIALSNPPEIQIIAHENTTQAILQAARLYDLVILPFVRNRTSPGELAMSDVTTALASQLTCSIVMLGEPQRTQGAMFSEVSTATTVQEGLVNSQ